MEFQQIISIVETSLTSAAVSAPPQVKQFLDDDEQAILALETAYTTDGNWQFVKDRLVDLVSGLKSQLIALGTLAAEDIEVIVKNTSDAIFGQITTGS